MKLTVFAIAVLAVAASIFFFTCSIFVVAPIGAVPDGRTLIISRLTNVNFIDSADGVCQREMGGVNLLCRGAVLGKIATAAKIYARMPYVDFLYTISTGGVRYDR